MKLIFPLLSLVADILGKIKRLLDVIVTAWEHIPVKSYTVFRSVIVRAFDQNPMDNFF